MKLQVINQRGLWWGISGAFILAGLVAIVLSWQQFQAPIRPGLDFVGGTRLQLELDCSKPGNCHPIDIAQVRQVLEAEELGDSSIQIVGNEQQAVSIRTKSLTAPLRAKLQNALSAKLGSFDPKKTQIDSVGPVLGKQLLTSGLMALLVSFAGIVVYLSLRFQLDYAIFAITALFHDILITFGLYSILGLIPSIRAEADSLFVVAMLTITGFSVNDTVVIYDRIRELLKLHPERHIDDIVDDAVNQTLTRSINTTLTVLLTLFAIFLFAEGSLKNFALTLIIGFTLGAYSSIFIASTLLAWWRERSGTATLAPAGLAVGEGPTEGTSELDDSGSGTSGSSGPRYGR